MAETLLIMLCGWAIEAAIGWPTWLYNLIRHPVVWIGSAITLLDKALNQTHHTPWVRYGLGALTSLGVVIGTALFASWLTSLMPPSVMGFVFQSMAASSLLASKSLYSHVGAVHAPLAAGDLEAAKSAVAMIVGRDTAMMEQTDVAKAALESLAENTSDGVIAPLFWGCCFGLPGLAAYKAINTLDSMIGHKNERHRAFGGFAARLDDIANLVPARLTGVLFALAGWSSRAVKAMAVDAGKHASPNAGWPEAAMAGVLGVRLGGPRTYPSAAKQGAHPWLNGSGRDAESADVAKGLSLYLRALAIFASVLLALTLWSAA
ncbi:MAG: adenosylcobinamide-phosphate synthase CbiB [Pseudomonadota bacterium]